MALRLKTWRTIILVQHTNERQPISAQNGTTQTRSDPFEPRLSFESKRSMSLHQTHRANDLAFESKRTIDQHDQLIARSADRDYARSIS